MSCITKVQYLPEVKDGMVKLVKNIQSSGVSRWVLRRESHNDSGWQEAKDSFYGLIGLNLEKWVPIENGTELIFLTSGSFSPIFSDIVWKDGAWYAWALTARCGNGHWTRLVEDPENSRSKSGYFCDNGTFCPMDNYKGDKQ